MLLVKQNHEAAWNPASRKLEIQNALSSPRAWLWHFSDSAESPTAKTDRPSGQLGMWRRISAARRLTVTESNFTDTCI